MGHGQSRAGGGVVLLLRDTGLPKGWFQSVRRPLASLPKKLNRGSAPGCSGTTWELSKSTDSWALPHNN